MAQTFERAKSRLNNILAIEPLLGALRTLSMGTWQIALKKIARMQQYEENYDHILIEILPKIEEIKLRKPKKAKKEVGIADAMILIIGTERGLCGKFNKVLANNAINWIDEQSFPSHQIWTMGSRMTRELERMGVNITWRKPLPASALPSYQQSYITTQTWLEQFEGYEFNHFFVLFNQIAKSGGYQFSSFRLLPYAIQRPISLVDKIERRWPPAIVETDPKGIYHQIIEHYIASSFYQILLKSAAAEHASRYNLMQEAKDNAQEIIEDLQQTINNERKRKITQEMQELASGAGLLDN